MQNDELIVQELKHACRLAGKMTRIYHRNSSDLESEAVWGLFLGGRRFKPELFRDFSAYSYHTIMGQMKCFVRYKYQQPFEELEDIHPVRDDYETLAMQGELQRKLKRIVGRLPKREREVIRLYFMQGWNDREIGEHFGFATDRGCSRVSQIKRAALKRMRATLERRGVEKVADIL